MFLDHSLVQINVHHTPHEATWHRPSFLHTPNSWESHPPSFFRDQAITAAQLDVQQILQVKQLTNEITLATLQGLRSCSQPSSTSSTNKPTNPVPFYPQN